MALSHAELDFVASAADYLEHPSFLIKLAGLAGRPAEVVLSALPSRMQNFVAESTTAALRQALDVAIRSIPVGRAATNLVGETPPISGVSGRWHTALSATTGAVGGFFGLPGLAMELPATTTIMLRSIARIARDQGADLSDPQVRLQCLSVFSYGSPKLETMESAYFSGRLGMAMAVKDATAFIASHGAREASQAVAKGTAPVLVRLLNQIAGRFQVVVTEKIAAQSIPLAGAASGAMINAAFTDHFNTVARYHFGIVALEARHGLAEVQAAYQQARGKRLPALRTAAAG